MPDAMKFGLFSMNMDTCSEPEVAARVARAAEAAGFESLWTGEHVVLPDPRVPASPMKATDRILDPLVALTFLAAHTTRVLLGTGIIILPQRNPLVLAKEIASLDALSGGRFIFGLGVGYLEPEFRALGIPFADRGPRTDGYLEAMQALWYDEAPAYHGPFASFAGVQAYPRPTHIPIVIGGHSPGAYRRTVERGNGWYGYGLDLSGAAQHLAALREAVQRYERPAALGELEISITSRGVVDREVAAQFAALGVHRLILKPPEKVNAAMLEAFVTDVSETLIGQV